MSTDTPRNRPEVIPVVQEQLEVGKRERETGKVRVTKSSHRQIRHIEVPLSNEEIDVVRVAKNEVVADPPPVREEGDTTIIPVLEEEIVIQKRLVLREEVHVTRRHAERNFTEDIPLKVESVTVERSKPGRSGEVSEPGTKSPE